MHSECFTRQHTYMFRFLVQFLASKNFHIEYVKDRDMRASIKRGYFELL